MAMIKEPGTLLSLDIGSIHTRAAFYATVDGKYHLLSSGSAPTTAGSPFFDITRGIKDALLQIQEVIGWQLSDEDHLIITPGQSHNHVGTDHLVCTFSAGPEFRVVVAGISQEGSLADARNLAASTFATVVDKALLSSGILPEVLIDALLSADADLVILAGGSNQGAKRPVIKLVDLTAMFYASQSGEKRPELLFAGNTALGSLVRGRLQKWTTVHLVPNLRPETDQVDPSPAREMLQRIMTRHQMERVGGLKDLARICTTPPTPIPQGIERMARYYSLMDTDSGRVLCLDLGSRYTTLIAAVDGNAVPNALPYGMGEGLSTILDRIPIQQISQWLPLPISEQDLRDYLYEKTLYPASLPLSAESMAMDQALARVLIRQALLATWSRWDSRAVNFGSILASGGVLTQAPDLAQTLMILLDALQPIGVSRIILDEHHLLAGLGASARIAPILPVQVSESSAMINLATLICPVSRAKPGTRILNLHIRTGDGKSMATFINQGAFQRIPLAMGVEAEIQLEPLRGTTVIPGRGSHTQTICATGSVYGLVIDARGRPLRLPESDEQRMSMIHKWVGVITG